MGCGVSCPNIPLNGDWELDDPVGQSMDVYRSHEMRLKPIFVQSCDVGASAGI